tara:strand:- start:219 stop:755 length:537 start_codon:yes stop_codon:yes gene_type:complete
MKFKVFRYKKVKSTNNTAIRVLKKTNYNFGMIISETQTGGKGQYGRKWISFKGNIFITFFYKLKKINLSMKQLSKKNCFLVKDVISKFYKHKIVYKSPNDLLINKKKICGILQEKINKSGNDYLIFGIGFNLVKSPIILNYPTTNLFEITKKKVKTEIFKNQLKKSFGKFLSQYYKTK